jgi:hypothetical protein
LTLLKRSSSSFRAGSAVRVNSKYSRLALLRSDWQTGLRRHFPLEKDRLQPVSMDGSSRNVVVQAPPVRIAGIRENLHNLWINTLSVTVHRERFTVKVHHERFTVKVHHERFTVNGSP